MAEVLASLKKIGGNGEQYTETVLWTNPNPTAGFARTTVTLSDNISNYKYIAIRTKPTKSDTDASHVITFYMLSSEMAVAGGINNYLAVEGFTNSATYVRRVIYQTDTTILIIEGTRLNASGSSNDIAIPLEILGINELAHGKQHDNSIKISHIYARLWSASNTALGGAQITLDGRDTVTVGSRDSAFTSCRCDFYAIDNTLLEQNDIPVGGGTFTAPANAYNVYIWGARSTAGQASISDIEIYKGE